MIFIRKRKTLGAIFDGESIEVISYGAAYI